jgi:hypothetical protein
LGGGRVASDSIAFQGLLHDLPGDGAVSFEHEYGVSLANHQADKKTLTQVRSGF